MRTPAIRLLLVFLLSSGLAAAPLPSTVSDQALALGASLEGWARSQGMADWNLKLSADRTAEVGRWPVTVTFLVGPTVTKDQVDRAELAFYPWFRKTAPGLVPEAVFYREETWQGNLTPPGIAIGSEASHMGPDLGQGLSQAQSEWFNDPENNRFTSVRVTWSWPADLSPAQESAEAQARQSRQDRIPATWTKLPKPAHGTGSEAWAERTAGGTGLAEALEKAYRETARLGKPTKVLPSYSLAMSREGTDGTGSRAVNTWYPDQVFQTLGLPLELADHPGPLAWSQWSPVRRLWGPGQIRVNFQVRFEFEISKVADVAAWRNTAQEDLIGMTTLRIGGWRWGSPEQKAGTEPVEITLEEYDSQVLSALEAFRQRHQP